MNHEKFRENSKRLTGLLMIILHFDWLISQFVIHIATEQLPA